MQNSGSVYPHPGVVFCIVVRNMEPDACALCQFAAVNAVLVRICLAVIESTEKVFVGCGDLFSKRSPPFFPPQNPQTYHIQTRHQTDHQIRHLPHDPRGNDRSDQNRSCR